MERCPVCLHVHVRVGSSKEEERLVGNREGKGWDGHLAEDAGKTIHTLLSA